MATRTPKSESTAAEEASDEEREGETAGSVPDSASDESIDRLVEEMIQSRTAELEAELEAVEQQVEELENFARISLNERKIKQTEANLSEFSESLTQFAEKAFNTINALEERLDVQALLLAAMLDALEDEDVDLDLAAVERFQQENIVTTESPDEQLEDAIERH